MFRLTSLLPTHLRDSQAELRGRAIAIGVFALCLTMACWLAALLQFIENNDTLLIAYLVTSTVLLATPVMLYLRVSVSFCGNWLTLILFIVLSVANWDHEALGYPSWYGLLLVPMLGILGAGGRAGVFWLAICTLELLGLWLVTAIGMRTIVVPSGSGWDLLQLLGAMVVMLTGFGLVFAYEQIKHKTLAEQMNALSALKQSKQLLKQATRVSKLGHAHFNEVTQKYISVSEQYANIFGYTAVEFLKRYRTLERDMELVHPEDRAKIDAFNETIQCEWTALEYRIQHQDGSVRHVREIVRHIVDEKGKLHESVATLQDITDLKLAQ